MTFKTSGVCSREISFEIDESNDSIKSVHFVGGCAGNASGISRLVEGMKVKDVISKLEGTTCSGRPTSCPDQLAKALKEWRSKE